MIKLKISSVNKKTLNLYTHKLLKLFKKFNIFYTFSYLPKKKIYITFLKSPHVNKKSQEHFFLTKYKGVICLRNLETKHKIVKSLILNKPTGIVLQIKLLGR